MGRPTCVQIQALEPQQRRPAYGRMAQAETAGKTDKTAGGRMGLARIVHPMLECAPIRKFPRSPPDRLPCRSQPPGTVSARTSKSPLLNTVYTVIHFADRKRG